MRLARILLASVMLLTCQAIEPPEAVGQLRYYGNATFVNDTLDNTETITLTGMQFTQNKPATFQVTGTNISGTTNILCVLGYNADNETTPIYAPGRSSTDSVTLSASRLSHMFSISSSVAKRNNCKCYGTGTQSVVLKGWGRSVVP